MARCTSVLIPIALFLVIGNSPVQSAPGNPQPGKLKLTILESDSGQPTPARVELQDSKGQGYVAEDALPAGGDCEGMGKEPEWDTLEEAIARLSKKVQNTYTGTVQFYSAGQVETSLPPGAYQLRVFKGIEYQAQTRQLKIRSNETTEFEVKMTRWVNMPEQGWFWCRRSSAHRPSGGGTQPFHIQDHAGRRYPRRQPVADGLLPSQHHSSICAWTREHLPRRVTTSWPQGRRIHEPIFWVTPLPWEPIRNSTFPRITSSTDCSGKRRTVRGRLSGYAHFGTTTTMAPPSYRPGRRSAPRLIELSGSVAVQSGSLRGLVRDSKYRVSHHTDCGDGLSVCQERRYRAGSGSTRKSRVH